MMMDWEKILSRDLFTERAEMPESWAQYEVDEFERGRSEAMNSALFRGLQDKTQAFPAGKKTTHTRLTHSLEVASIGERFGKMVCLSKKGRELFGDKAEEYARGMASVLSTAGLLHDLGNPPFGHSGESGMGYALKKLCKNGDVRFKGRRLDEVLTAQMIADLSRFEGNAQTIRILLKTRLNPCPDNPNVTRAVINTLVKYPVNSLNARKEARDARIRKFSTFLSEERVLGEIREAAGVTGCSRYPLTFLLEAADDISYLVSDIADAIADDTAKIHEVRDFIGKELKRIPDFGPDEDEMQKMAVTELFNRLNTLLGVAFDAEAIHSAYRTWLEYVRNWLIYAAVHSFFAHYEAIMDGSYAGELLMDGWYYYGVRILKKLVTEFTYDEKKKNASDIAGFTVMSELLGMFVPAVLHWTVEDELNGTDALQEAYIRLLPEKLKAEYMAEKSGDMVNDLYLRIHMVTDYLSGLTDAEASDLYRTLKGL